MIQIPVKKAEAMKVARALEQYVMKNYDGPTAEKVRPFFMALDESRRAASEGESMGAEVAIAGLESYLAGLRQVETRVSIASTDLKFQWFDSYTKGKHPVLSFGLEKVCIMYALAGYNSKIGAEVDLKAVNSHKIALASFQTAAGWLNLAIETLNEGISDQKFDVSADNMQIWHDVMIAQGYFTMYDKLDKQTANKINISKVAFSAYRNYDNAINRLYLMKSFPKDLENTLRFYSNFFLASAYYYYALNDKEKAVKTGAEFGKVVSRLKAAEGYITKAMQLKGIRGTGFEIGRNLLSAVTRERESCEADNFSIYMDRVVEESALESIDLLNMVTGKLGELRQCSGQELMNSVVPIEVMSTHREYEAFVYQVLQTYKGKIDAFDQNLMNQLNVAVGKGIPESLWAEISQAQAKNTEKNLQMLKEIKAGVRNTLGQAKTQILQEEQDDEALKKKYGASWTVPPSSIMNTGLKSGIETYLKKLEEADEPDQKTEADYFSQKSMIEAILRPRDSLDRLIPEVDVSLSAQRERLVSTIKASQQTLESLIAQYNTSLNAFNPAPELRKIKEECLDKQTVFESLNEEFSEIREQIDSELEAATENLMEISRISQGLDIEKRAKKEIDELRMALEVKKVIDKRIEEGLEFYHKFLERAFALEKDASELVKTRELIKKELEQSLNKPVGKMPESKPSAPVATPQKGNVQQVPPPQNVTGAPQSGNNPQYPGYPAPYAQYPPQGHVPPQAYVAPQNYSPQNYPPQGFSPQGYPPQGYPPQPYPPQGYPPQGYPPQGHSPQGYPPQGHSPQGYPPQGHFPQGYPPQGYPPANYPPQGFSGANMPPSQYNYPPNPNYPGGYQYPQGPPQNIPYQFHKK